jgi:hypothetical protein
MKAQLIKYVKVIDELDNIIEIKIWQLPEPTKDKPHGYKYSLVYIIDDIRVIGYDNAEGKGDHIHYRELREPYEFMDIDKLLEDFYKDIRRVKHESQKSKNRD